MLTGRNDTAKNDTEIEVDNTSTVVDADIDHENTTEDNDISIEEIVPPDYECELDEEPFDEYGDECNVSLPQNEILPVEGVMHNFLKKVQNRLKIEVCNERSNDGLCKKWLLEHLKSNNWWLRRQHYITICDKLNLSCDEFAYYRDVYI